MSVRISINSIIFKRLIFLFAKNFCIVAVCFFFMTFLLEYMEVVRRFPDRNYGVLTCLAASRSFVTFSSFFPFASLLGSVLFFMTAHKKLELTIIKGAGVSSRQIMSCLLLAVSLIGVVYITIIDATSVILINKTRRIEAKLKKEQTEESEVAITNRGIWFRDVLGHRSYIIYAKSFANKTKELSNVRIFEFNKDREISSSMFSDSASISEGFWNLRNVKVLMASGREETIESLKIPTDLSFKSMDRITANPKGISFWTMSKYISIVEKVGLSSLKYKISWLSRISSIMQMLAFAILASIFCIDSGGMRSRNGKLRTSILLSLAFPIHFAQSVMTAFGENGDIPAWIAVFSIPFVVIALCSKSIIKD